MGILARRFLVLAALMFWQGGFTFYAAVVVPVGRQTIGSQQSEVTRPVTLYLNVAGAVALLPFAWDIASCPDSRRRRRVIRWTAWAGLAVTLAALLGLHQIMSGHLHAGVSPTQPPFHNLHRAYLWVSTVQWACSLVFAGASLHAWRAEDRIASTPRPVEQGPSPAVDGTR